MLLNVLLLSLSLLGSATALPSPSPADSIAILSARGIDPAGPIPADAVPIPGGGFSFEADSDTSHWVRVQSTSGLAKRQNSGLSMTMWAQAGCGGSGAFFGNVQYGASQVGSQSFYLSIQFPGRALLAKEQLDFSVINQLTGNRCATFVRTAPRQSGPGCFNEPAFSCFRLFSN